MHGGPVEDLAGNREMESAEMSRENSRIGSMVRCQAVLATAGLMIGLLTGAGPALSVAAPAFFDRSGAVKLPPTHSLDVNPTTPKVDTPADSLSHQGGQVAAATAEAIDAWAKRGDASYARKDFPGAASWYDKAAAAGNVHAMGRLGLMYLLGRGVEQDFEKGRQWAQKAAAAGNSGAYYCLGAVYENGLGVDKDPQQAIDWFTKSAATGDAAAMRKLGYMYHQGLGAERDYQQARDWYEKAAAAGNVAAMRDLGDMYIRGEGVPKDPAKADEWYRKAAAAPASRD